MSDFLKAIPLAAKSEYALFAYVFAAVLFVVAGARLRSLKSVLKSISLVPSDERRHVIESVTNSVIPESISAEQWIRNNRNRWIYFVVLSSVMLLAVIGIVAYTTKMPVVGPGPSPSNADAEVALKNWLTLQDNFDFEASYRELYTSMRAGAPVETWIDLSRRYRAPLGRVISRTLASTNSAISTLDVPVNTKEYMYATKFENSAQPIREYIALASPGVPVPWKVAGYHIDVSP